MVPERKVAAHRFLAIDLRAVAVGEIDDSMIRRLKAAEFSRHQLLLAALMRAAATYAADTYAATLVPAYRLLAAVQARDRDSSAACSPCLRSAAGPPSA